MKAATAVRQLVTPIARIELLDDMQMRAFIIYSRLAVAGPAGVRR